MKEHGNRHGADAAWYGGESGGDDGSGWKIDVADDVRVAVDADDLAEMLGNLAENAVKWARSIVRIVARTDTGGLVLAVEDDGPGIPADGIETAVLQFVVPNAVNLPAC